MAFYPEEDQVAQKPAVVRNQSGATGLSMDRLLAANTGVGERQAQNLASRAQGAVQKAQGSTQQASNTFNTAVDAGVQGTSYAGPKGPGEYFNAAAQDTDRAQQQITGLQSTAGRQTQLGGSLLDSLLAGRAGGKQFRAMQPQGAALTKTFGDTYTRAGMTAKAGQSAADQNLARQDQQAAADVAQRNAAAEHQATSAQQANDIAATMGNYGKFVTDPDFGIGGLGTRIGAVPVGYQEFAAMTPEQQIALGHAGSDADVFKSMQPIRQSRQAGAQDQANLMMQRLLQNLQGKK